MDLWIVAAATGAGYVAKHWKKLSKEDDSVESSFSSGDDKKFKNLIREVRDRTEPYVLEDGRFSGHRWFDVCNREATASSSDSQSVSEIQLLRNRSSRRMQLTSIEMHGGMNRMHEKESSSFVFNKNRHHRSLSRQPWNPSDSCLAEYSSGLPNFLQGRSDNPETDNYRIYTGLSGMLFILGLTIGIISGIVTYREEIDRLNKVVNQTQSLVYDLHEQLEMKEQCMNVKEISTNGSSLINRESVMPCVESNWDPEKLNNIEEIEAELEAELERLELNFHITDFVELDSDFEIDIIRGDVKLDGPEIFSDSDEVSSTMGTQISSPNYAVKPQDLALRLHQVLQEQLEARIHELEVALEVTQKKLDSA